MAKSHWFKSKRHFNCINNEGYSKLELAENFSATVLLDLMDKLNTVHVDFEGNQNSGISVSYHSTFLDTNKKYKELIWNLFHSYLKNLCDSIFQDFKIIQINIFNKPPSTGYICPHQNLTTVDEDKYRSYSIWVPLQDVNEKNGRLEFIPNSHKKFEKIRSHEIFWKPLRIFEAFKNQFSFCPVNVKFGEFLVFDDAIVHCSEKNDTVKNRVVLHCLVTHKDAACIYPKIEGDKVYLHKVADQFWHYFTPGECAEFTELYGISEYEPKEYDFNSVMDEIYEKLV